MFSTLQFWWEKLISFFMNYLITIYQKFVLPYSTKYTTRDLELKFFYSLFRKSLVIFTDNKLLLFYFSNSTNIKDKLHKLLATTLWSITCKKQGIAVFNIFLEYKNTHIVFFYISFCAYTSGVAFLEPICKSGPSWSNLGSVDDMELCIRNRR